MARPPRRQIVRATSDGSPRFATVSILLGLAWLLQLLDGITAVQMMQAHGTAAELNPLIQSMFVQMGIVGVAATKAAVAGRSGSCSRAWLVAGSYARLASVYSSRDCLAWLAACRISSPASAFS